MLEYEVHCDIWSPGNGAWKLRKHDKAVCFSWQLMELALQITKSYSFKGLFMCCEQA